MGERDDSAVNEKKVAVLVGTIAHVHPATRASLLASLLESGVVVLNDRDLSADGLVTKEVAEKHGLDADLLNAVIQFESAREFDSPPIGHFEMLEDMSPYGYNPKKSKGEKKRERAFNRRFYGKGNTF